MPIAGDVTPVRIHMLNTASIAVAYVPTPNGAVEYEGEARIDGVPGTAAAIPLEFLDVAGSSCGSLLPTGSAVDEINGVRVTCIDNGMPVVILRAEDFRLSGDETPEQLESNATLEAADRSHPARRRPAHESRRRDQEDRAEDVPGVAAEAGRRDFHSHIHSASSA